MDVVDDELDYRSVNLETDLQTCLAFRRDAWKASYGSDETFSAAATIKWFQRIAKHNPESFLLVWHGDRCIGQLEFMPDLKTAEGESFAHINLFYLIPEYRGNGFGQLLHDYVIEALKRWGCRDASLRYIPGNDRAERFYLKNGWYKEGEPTEERGQLMKKNLSKE
ncbi:GNAT family N-acetyltransferase [Parendozoicomonas haliclonae]|uniref:Acetyltransferase (GNAT) family protein n=1 Tax=Parendozoicomonas haliclonae TaxID=1960125 RepID=A0A1X7AIY1_9GAMM|nr:GNAT family N-acetyltransferase [Parendozoicomonas haliclonae]SMA44092.1 Acetyltransferase (GNAT) family protein [Parendozoicomonas haliclonae]